MNFNGGNSCIQMYINQNKLFLITANQNDFICDDTEYVILILQLHYINILKKNIDTNNINVYFSIYKFSLNIYI